MSLLVSVCITTLKIVCNRTTVVLNTTTAVSSISSAMVLWSSWAQQLQDSQAVRRAVRGLAGGRVDAHAFAQLTSR